MEYVPNATTAAGLSAAQIAKALGLTPAEQKQVQAAGPGPRKAPKPRQNFSGFELSADALESLRGWLLNKGVVLPEGYTAEVKARERVGTETGAIRLDTYYYDAQGRRYRSKNEVAKELGLQIGKSDAPQLAVEKAAAGKGKGGKGKKAKDSTTPAGPPLQQAQHDPIKVLLRIGGRMLYAGADAEASGPGNGAEAPSPQPKGAQQLPRWAGVRARSGSADVSRPGSGSGSGDGSAERDTDEAATAQGAKRQRSGPSLPKPAAASGRQPEADAEGSQEDEPLGRHPAGGFVSELPEPLNVARPSQRGVGAEDFAPPETLKGRRRAAEAARLEQMVAQRRAAREAAWTAVRVPRIPLHQLLAAALGCAVPPLPDPSALPKRPPSASKPRQPRAPAADGGGGPRKVSNKLFMSGAFKPAPGTEVEKLAAFVQGAGGCLGEGWSAKRRLRTSGIRAGAYDTYYISPDGEVCRSRAEVVRYLNSIGLFHAPGSAAATAAAAQAAKAPPAAAKAAPDTTPGRGTAGQADSAAKAVADAAVLMDAEPRSSDRQQGGDTTAAPEPQAAQRAAVEGAASAEDAAAAAKAAERRAARQRRKGQKRKRREEEAAAAAAGAAAQAAEAAKPEAAVAAAAHVAPPVQEMQDVRPDAQQQQQQPRSPQDCNGFATSPQQQQSQQQQPSSVRQSADPEAHAIEVHAALLGLPRHTPSPPRPPPPAPPPEVLAGWV